MAMDGPAPDGAGSSTSMSDGPPGSEPVDGDRRVGGPAGARPPTAETTGAPRARRPRGRWLKVLAALAALVIVAGLGAVAVMRPTATESRCPAIGDHPDWSVARRWDEALLDAIRRALPNPPVHARNLFHMSVAMWDAWAAYDPHASGYIVTEKDRAPDLAAARAEAISYAA